jgi:hypothetical protein
MSHQLTQNIRDSRLIISPNQYLPAQIAQIEINHKIAIGAISYLNGYYYVETLKS